MAITLIKTDAKPLDANEYDVIYEGDWNDGDYLYRFDVVTEDDFPSLIMWLDFFSKRDEIEGGSNDFRTNRSGCLITYFSDWLDKNGYTDYDNNLIEELAEYVDENMCVLPYESSSSYNIHSLEITLKKDGQEYELSYTAEDVDAVIKNILIGNCIIAE